MGAFVQGPEMEPGPFWARNCGGPFESFFAEKILGPIVSCNWLRSPVACTPFVEVALGVAFPQMPLGEIGALESIRGALPSGEKVGAEVPQ